ncbi:MAG: DNA replication and repair protein RecF [Thermoanaerobaculia bacterium]
MSAPLQAPLRRLRLENFRSLESVDWRPAPGFNLVQGANGSGKSSLLEAIYLAATGRSFRTPALVECCSRGFEAFQIRAEVADADPGPVASSGNPEVPSDAVSLDAVSSDLVVAWVDGMRRQSVQQRPSSLAEHLARLPVVAWSEAERELVSGPSLTRRRFLDRAALLLKPGRLAEHSELHRVMAQKRHLLAARHRAYDAQEVAAWNELLAPLIARRARERAALAAQLEKTTSDLLMRHGSDLPPSRIRYVASPPAALHPDPAAAIEAVAEALRSAAAAERERAQPLLGPQRDRVEIVMDENAVRRFASAGERKLLALALLAALAELLVVGERAPLVLLDDLDAELDGSRLALAAALFSRAPQVIATTSRPALFRSPDLAPEALRGGAHWALVDGLLTPA